VVAADLGFHRALVEATGNSRLLRVHEDLGAEIQLWQAQLTRGYASPKQTAAEHEELLGLIGKGNLQQSARAIRDHLEGALDWLVANAG
jgi:DNA-binding FadR family transcriptional regulator